MKIFKPSFAPRLLDFRTQTLNCYAFGLKKYVDVGLAADRLRAAAQIQLTLFLHGP